LRDHGEFDVFGLLIRRNRSKASWALATTIWFSNLDKRGWSVAVSSRVRRAVCSASPTNWPRSTRAAVCSPNSARTWTGKYLF